MAKPITPEPKFFLGKDFDKGLAYYEKTYFPEERDGVLWRGEKSTTYHERETAAQRIRASYPDALILFILRHPTHRAISNYFFSKNNALETRTLEEVFLWKTPPPAVSAKVSTDPFDYLARGDYAKYLQIYLKHFKEDQLIILTFESFANDLAAIQRLYSRLDIDPAVVPSSLNRHVNASNTTKGVSIEIVNVLNEYYRLKICELETLLRRRIREWER